MLILILSFVIIRQYKVSVPQISPPLVSIISVKKKILASSLTLPGTIISPKIVNLRPRVEGELQSVNFKEGDFVKKDQLLLSIDDTLLQAQLRQAQATLARDQADLKYRAAEVARNKSLFEKHLISTSQYDQIVANFDKANETIFIDQAIIEQYKIQIDYCKIYSPLEGRIGFQEVNPGNVIRLSDKNYLATIVQLDPLEIEFALPEKYLAQINQKNLLEKKIYITMSNYKHFSFSGSVKIINNQIETSSGTLLIRGEFSNKEHLLIPGQYMTIKLDLEEPSAKLIIPLEACQIGQESSYVYVYDPNQEKVFYRPIITESIDDKFLWVQKGLKEGDLILIAGHLKVKDQAKVRIAQNNQTSDHKNKIDSQSKNS